MTPLVVDHPNSDEFVNKLTSRFEKAGKSTLKEVAGEIQSEMQVEGAPSTSPVQWDSERQRRAYFASNGFGAGIPYVRKGDYIRGWSVRSLPNGYEITNKHPAGAVGGTLRGVESLKFGEAVITVQTWQSRIHKMRWKNILHVAVRAVKGLTARVMERLKVTTRND